MSAGHRHSQLKTAEQEEEGSSKDIRDSGCHALACGLCRGGEYQQSIYKARREYHMSIIIVRSSIVLDHTVVYTIHHFLS
jgi:hypothetical protein